MELLGTYEDRSCVYIVMEECRGGDLETLLEARCPHLSSAGKWSAVLPVEQHIVRGWPSRIPEARCCRASQHPASDVCNLVAGVQSSPTLYKLQSSISRSLVQRLFSRSLLLKGCFT